MENFDIMNTIKMIGGLLVIGFCLYKMFLHYFRKERKYKVINVLDDLMLEVQYVGKMDYLLNKLKGYSSKKTKLIKIYALEIEENKERQTKEFLTNLLTNRMILVVKKLNVFSKTPVCAIRLLQKNEVIFMNNSEDIVYACMKNYNFKLSKNLRKMDKFIYKFTIPHSNN